MTDEPEEKDAAEKPKPVKREKSIYQLIEESSLGTPRAKRMRNRTSTHLAREIVRRSQEK